MTERNKGEVKVYVKGKLIALKDLEKEYPQISLTGTPGRIRLIESLAKAEKPLTRKDIAERIGISSAHTRSLLKKLAKMSYVLEFHIGGRTLYYLLTEKGLELAKDVMK